MNPLVKEITAVLLGAGSSQAVVLRMVGTDALLATPAGTRLAAASGLDLSPGDTVTLNGDRIIAKRTSASDRTYYV